MELPVEGADYFIYYSELPPKIYAFVALNPDGTYSIYLDPRRDFEHRLDDMEHEIMHIIRDDLYNGKPIQEVESL